MKFRKFVGCEGERMRDGFVRGALLGLNLALRFSGFRL